jgi:subtilisin family serine protease
VRQAALTLTLLGLIGVAGFSAASRTAGAAKAASPSVEVTYTSRAALVRALNVRPARLVRVVAPLHVAEVRPAGPIGKYVRALRRLPGIAFAHATVGRTSAVSAAVGSGPAVAEVSPDVAAGEWQYSAVGLDRVPPDVLAAAARITIAVVDTGADVTSPSLMGKVRGTYDVRNGGRRVPDADGHGTFVASLAGGVSPGGEGIAGFGGAAQLLVVKVANSTRFSDVDVAAGIVYAVRHGARIVNLSVAGREPSVVEQAALEFAARHGVLVVAAAGNDALAGDPPEYPAALLQPVGSNGVGGLGLSVAASDANGARAGFSEFGSFVSLAAPGVAVFGAVPVRKVAGVSRSAYEYASGTSFAAPEVAGAAALVWAANPRLSFRRVARILKQTASGSGDWSPELGYGVIDAAAAVQRATAASSAGG